MKTLQLKDFGWGASLLSSWEHAKRHGGSILRHLTVPRAINAGLLLLDLALRRRVCRSRPIVVKIEPTNVCNFRCPGCRTGSGQDKSRRGMIRFDDFRSIVDQTCRHAFKCILYMWGEPLIHPDLFRMVRYAAMKNMAVQLSSNLNVFRPSYADQLVQSGLEHLIVAMDGVSQEVYEVYRVGGQVQKVVDNLEAILRARRTRGSRLPFVELQYIVFEHNRHEIPEARQLAERLGVDRLTIIDSQSRATRPAAGAGPRRRAREKCNMLWMMACVNWDGSLSPCCDSVDDSFGNVLEQGLDVLWNSEKMQRSRSLQTGHPIGGGPRTKCSRCVIRGSRVTFLPEVEPGGSPASARRPERQLV
jgi:radical SAM protein with 4Fe4S-binding SPASM domain